MGEPATILDMTKIRVDAEQVAARIPRAMVNKIDALAKAMAPLGVEALQRSEVVRAAITLGLERLEKEYDITDVVVTEPRVIRRPRKKKP